MPETRHSNPSELLCIFNAEVVYNTTILALAFTEGLYCNWCYITMPPAFYPDCPWTCATCKSKVPVHTMKVYRRNGSVAPLILYLSSRGRLVVYLTPQSLQAIKSPHQYLLNRGLGGLQSWCGHLWRRKNLQGSTWILDFMTELSIESKLLQNSSLLGPNSSRQQGFKPPISSSPSSSLFTIYDLVLCWSLLQDILVHCWETTFSLFHSHQW